MFLQASEEVVKEHGVYHTRREIAQQPRLWEQAYEYIYQNQETIQHFFRQIFDKHNQIKVIFAGAGTSAFVGECITPFLCRVKLQEQVSFEHIATTDIVSNPKDYLDTYIPTVMVSFARSGSSPESVAAVELGEKRINHFYKMHITCNPDGYLANKYKNDPNSLLLLMPDGSNDQGFAMTSSFTSMMLSALLVFQISELESVRQHVWEIIDITRWIQENKVEELDKVASESFSNIVYLGSGSLQGLAHEAALKMLELTNGNVFTSYDSPLGFRHGPKSTINDQTLIVMFISNDNYTRKYDLDMLTELFHEKGEMKLKILAISDRFIEEISAVCDYYFYYDGEELEEAKNQLDDIWLSFPYIFYAQVLAVSKSLYLGFKPDNPSPSGSVNRVVQGVTIYPFNE